MSTAQSTADNTPEHMAKLGRGENNAVHFDIDKMTDLKDAMVALWNAANEPVPSKPSMRCVSRRQKKEEGDKAKKPKAKSKLKTPRAAPQIRKRRSKKTGRTGNPCTTDVKHNMIKTFQNVMDASTKLPQEHRREVIGDLFVMMMQVRNCRKTGAGKGARYPARRLFILLAKKCPKTAVAMLRLFPEFGYWKDLNELLIMVRGYESEYCPLVREKVYELYAQQLLADQRALAAWEEKQEEAGRKRAAPGDEQKTRKGLALSLAAKWAPKRNKSCARQTDARHGIAKKMFGERTEHVGREYDRVVSLLNNALDTTEIKMSSYSFSNIEFSKVPGRCLNRNKRVWLDLEPGDNDVRRHDGWPDRAQCAENFKNFLEKVKTGKASAKGQSVTVDALVEQAVRLVRSQEKQAEKDLVEAQWRDHEEALKAEIAKGKELGSGIVLADVSGSMSGTPMHLAIALAILISRHADNPWKHKFITFDSNPAMLDISKYTTFMEAVQFVKDSPWGGSTDFLKVFDLILDLAKENKLADEHLPKWLMVVSDMQFNQACNRSEIKSDTWETHHEIILKKFKEAGESIIGKPYTPPTLIYWNARAAIKGLPVDATQEGAVMVSGCSSAMIKMFLNEGNFDKIPTPYGTLRKALDSPDYDEVKKIIEEVGETPCLNGYKGKLLAPQKEKAATEVSSKLPDSSACKTTDTA